MTNTYQNGWDCMNYKLNDHIRDGLITLKIPSSSKIVGPWASTLTFEISRGLDDLLSVHFSIFYCKPKRLISK